MPRRVSLSFACRQAAHSPGSAPSPSQTSSDSRSGMRKGYCLSRYRRFSVPRPGPRPGGEHQLDSCRRLRWLSFSGKAVLAELGRCAIAHFACHGYSDPADPSHSRLLLHDSAEPLTVASLAPVNLSHADLAYLSACQTAINSAARLIDEAIHLSAAFQLAGFRQVIGTPWEIEDEISARVAAAC